MFGSILRSRFVRQHAYHIFTAAVHRPSRRVRVSIYYKRSFAAAAVGAQVKRKGDASPTNNHVSKVEDKEPDKPNSRQLKSEIHSLHPSKTPSSSHKSVIADLKVSLKRGERLKNVPSAEATGEESSSIENVGTKSLNDSGGPEPNPKSKSSKTKRFRYARWRMAKKKIKAAQRSILGSLVGEVKNGEISNPKTDKRPDKQAESVVQPVVIEPKPPKSTESPTNPVSSPDQAGPSDLFGRVATNQLSQRDKALILHFLRDSIPTSRVARPLRHTGLRKRMVQPETFKIQSRPDFMRSVGGKKKEKEKAGISGCGMETIEATGLKLVPINKPQPPVPRLAYGLERVLFNPGVYQLQDPRSRVFNFDPYLQSIMPVADFDFGALKEYITSSRDETLTSTAAEEGKKYTGSTSSMTSPLAHFHYLLSQWRPVNASNLSQGFPEELSSFTLLQRAPSAIFLRWKDGTYAIDADKEFDTTNILMMLGKSMEKLLTLPTNEFERYRKQSPEQITDDERNDEQSYHYTTMGDFLMRSQLDAYDPRVPGTGMFDLKTRAVISIRMDAQNYHVGSGYEIRSRFGEYESYEREYYDMIRAAFLKYSLQVRMGRMDGIFVAFHNVERIFGFQYISLPEMDLALHGQEDLTIGDSEFKLSLELLNRVLDRATTKYPKQSLRLFFETRETTTPFMYIFAEPIREEEIKAIQESKRAEIEEYERDLLGIDRTSPGAKDEEGDNEGDRREIQQNFEKVLDSDELSIADGNQNLQEDDADNMISNSGVQLHSSGHGQAKIINGGATEEQPLTLCVKEDPAHAGSAEIKLNATEETLHDEDKSHKEPRINLPRENAGEKDDKEALPSETNRVRGVLDSLKGHVHVASDMNHLSSNVQDQGDLPAVNGDAEGPDSNDSKEEGQQMAKSREPELLAMTLKIRNKVNEKYVVRPTHIGPGDLWSVEYAFAEVPGQTQARSLYEATKRRRAAALHGNKIKDKSRFTQALDSKLRELSEQGRKWRQKQTEIDQSSPVEVLKERFLSSQ